MQLQCDCFLRAQTACSLSKKQVLILQHKDPVKHQGEKERLRAPLFKNIMLLSNCFLYFSLMYSHNLKFLKNKNFLLFISIFYHVVGTYYYMFMSVNRFSYIVPLNCQMNVLKIFIE